MLSTKNELFAAYLVCFTLLIINLSTGKNYHVTYLFLFVMVLLVVFDHFRKLRYLNKLKQYEDSAKTFYEDKVVKYVPPLIIEDEQIYGVEFNKLLRYIEQNRLISKRNLQIMKIITNNIEAPIVILNIDGEIEYANNRFKDWADLSVLKKMSFNHIANEELKNILQDALICETTRKSQIHLDGKVYVSVANPIYDMHEEFTGTIVMFHDITDIKKYESLQKDFFANASHELKTPISAIKGCTEILLNGAKEDPQALDEFLKIIETENERMERLVKDLLLINRFEYDQIKMKRQVFILNELLVKCVLQALNLANVKQQKIVVEATDEIEISGDYMQLEHCFLNLLSNAIHYSPEQTVIKISVSASDRGVELKFIDQGIGIPKQDIPHIFERFYRVDKARSRHTGGTGLGLSIVHSIVEAHKGTIKVHSTIDVGTTFIIFLPKKV